MTNAELRAELRRIAHACGPSHALYDVALEAADRIFDLVDERSQLASHLDEVMRELEGVRRLATAMASAIGWETEGEHWIDKATNAAERWRNFEQAQRHQAELAAN